MHFVWIATLLLSWYVMTFVRFFDFYFQLLIIDLHLSFVLSHERQCALI